MVQPKPTFRAIVSLVVGVLVLLPVVGQAQSPLEPYRDSISGTLVTFEMLPLPGGTVSVEGLQGIRSIEIKPVWIGRTEVTWDMYDVFALGLDRRSGSPVDPETSPSRPYGAPDYGYGHHDYPVISVTRAAAEAFCVWLSRKTGKKYRLPTEAEWAHAAQLGFGSKPLSPQHRDSVAWHRGNAEGKTHAVATRQPDALGLHDLLGNAAEWVTTEDSKLVVRGGSFRSLPAEIGPGARAVQDDSWNERDPQLPKSRWWLSDGPFVGFRIVREP